MANGLKKQKQKWKALAKHKSSLVLYLITILAAAITVFVLGYLIVYILANGIPHLKPSLFAFTYTSDNVSMMPALINTVLMTLATLIVAVPLGIFAAIYLVEYAKKVNNLNIRVMFVDEHSRQKLLITDFRKLGYEWKLYKGEKYIRCSSCGILVKRKTNNQKYCKDCAYEKQLERNRDYKSQFLNHNS